MDEITDTDHQRVAELDSGYTRCQARLIDGRSVVFYSGDHLLTAVEASPGELETVLILVDEREGGLKRSIACQHIIEITMESMRPGDELDDNIARLVEIY